MKTELASKHETHLIQERDRLINELTKERAALKHWQDQVTDRDQRLAAFAARERAADEFATGQSNKIASLQNRLHLAQTKLTNIVIAMASLD